jgi:hypothetical protein
MLQYHSEDNISCFIQVSSLKLINYILCCSHLLLKDDNKLHSMIFEALDQLLSIFQ